MCAASSSKSLLTATTLVSIVASFVLLLLLKSESAAADDTHNIYFTHWFKNLPHTHCIRHNRAYTYKEHKTLDAIFDETCPTYAAGINDTSYKITYNFMSPKHSFVPPYKSTGPFDITLISHLSPSRADKLEILARHWTGPAVFILYSNIRAHTEDVMRTVLQSPTLATRRNIRYHFVKSLAAAPHPYPSNYLRALATRDVHTPYVFNVDVDLAPRPGMYERMQVVLKLFNQTAVMAHNNNNTSSPVAFVVPAFETTQAMPFAFEKIFPKTKLDLIELMHDRITLANLVERRSDKKTRSEKKLQKVREFIQQVLPPDSPHNNASRRRESASGFIQPFLASDFAPAYSSTNYIRWFETDKIFEVPWMKNFEPFIIARTDQLPVYDKHVLWPYYDKTSNLLEAAIKNFRFFVLPNEFLIHTFHESGRQERLLQNEGFCRMLLKSMFFNSLQERYGVAVARPFLKKVLNKCLIVPGTSKLCVCSN